TNVSGNDGASVSVDASNLIITLGTAIGSSANVSLVVYNIKNPSYTKTTSNVTITSKVQINAVDYDKDSGILTPGPGITSGNFVDVSISATSHVAGESSIYTFGFTPAHNVGVGGFLTIGFELGYNASGAYITGSTGGGTYAVSSLSATSVTLNVTSAVNAGVAQTISLGDIINPAFVEDVTCTLESANASLGVIDESDTPILSITPAPLAVLSITASSYIAQDLSEYTIAFTNINPINQNGKVEIEFDADYDFSAVASNNVTGNANATVAVSSSTLIITLGTAVSSGEQVSLVVSNIKNPGVQTPTTSNFNLVTKNAAGNQLDYGLVAGKTIIAGTLSGLLATAGTVEVGESTTYNFDLSLEHNVPTNGYVRIQFDDNYSLANTTVVSSGYSLTKGANYLLLKRTGAALTGAISIQLNSIVNPAFVSNTLQGFAIQTQLANNQVIDIGTAAAITTTAGALSAATVMPVALGVSIVTDYTFNFTTDHAVSAGGKVIITVDSDYDLGAVQSSNVSGNTGSTVLVAGNVLTVTLGQAIAKNTAASLVIYNIKNPSYVQTTADFALETRNGANALIDQGTVSGVTTTAGALTSVSGVAINYAAGASTQYTFDFMPAHNVAAGGYLKIEFNLEYNISGAYVISPSAKYSISSKTGNILILNVLQEILPSSSQSINIGGITN
ncbi:hypothetical protein KJ761_03700, partial [Patescibacteria group bacterium]|nr:hypothetical protein [Patescibacteria group bacterium]